MWEVDDDSGNNPVPAAKSKKKDKGRDLLNKIKTPREEGEMSAKKQKEFNKFHYGKIDSDESDSDDGDGDVASKMRKRSKKEKGFFADIKWGHIAILVMMTGGAALPFVVMIADSLGPVVSKMVPNLAPMLVSLGLAATPKRRLTQFYEKHNPDKMSDVDMILQKYAGDYGTMTKKLESKYHDYGFFVQWEKDGGIVEKQQKLYAWVADEGGKYYQRYVPFPIRKAAKNIYGNGYNLYKKVYKWLDQSVGPGSGSGVKKSGGSKAGGRKSRRARNAEARED